MMGWSLLRGLAFVVVILAGAPAGAQVVEENPPPIRIGPQQSQLTAGDLTDVDTEVSDKPIRVTLTGLVFLDKPEAAHPKAVVHNRPIDVERVVLLQDKAFINEMEGFVGQPVSLRLLAKIRIATVEFYRDQNRPLVAVTVPQQEITQGVVQILVVEFSVGGISVAGNTWTPDNYIRENIHLRRGDIIDSDRLVADINWLNLNPFRNLGVVFEPGDAVGETDITLRAREEPPYSVYVGYSNTGTPSTDRSRIFKGFTVANLLRLDHQLSYQFTSSPNFWAEGGEWFPDGDQVDYLSHSGVYFIPLPWRHKFTASASYVDTNSVLTTPFTQEGDTLFLAGEYAIPISLSGPALVDLFGKFEYKQQKIDVAFAGTSIEKTTVEISQFAAGATGQIRSSFGITNFSAVGYWSPGGLFDDNDDAAFAAASDNPNADATYAYLLGSASHRMSLADTGFWLYARAQAQLASKSLPGIEQLAMGGVNTVRGYEALEVSGDKGVVVATELHFPTFSLLSNKGTGLSDQMDVFVFGDYGYVDSDFSDLDFDFLSAGVGLNYRLDDQLSISLVYGRALRDGFTTEAHDERIHFDLTLRH